MRETKMIAVALINEPPLPVREQMDDGKLEELAQSMQAEGLHQAIGVVQRGAVYDIVYGHRRYMCARKLGWLEIECKIYEEGSKDLRRAMLSENLYREDITPAEEGHFFVDVMELDGLDTDGVAAKFGKSRDYVEQRIALLQGHPDVLAAVRAREINFSIARLLNTVEDEGYLKYFLHLAVTTGSTFRTLDQMVRNWRMQNGAVQHPTAQPAADPAPEVQAVQRMECFICGGYRDPYNMTHVVIHHACKERIEAVIKESFEEKGS